MALAVTEPDLAVPCEKMTDRKKKKKSQVAEMTAFGRKYRKYKLEYFLVIDKVVPVAGEIDYDRSSPKKKYDL